MIELVEQLRVWVEQVIFLFGYPGITLLMLLENVIPPIPSEVVLPFAGFLVVSGKFNYWGVVVSATLGSVLGALVLYGLGRTVDERRLRGLVRRYGWLLQLTEADLDRSLVAFDRYGGALVLFGRVLPLIRSLVSIPAGLYRMKLGPFLFLTALGSAVWSGLLAYAGVLLGARWSEILVSARPVRERHPDDSWRAAAVAAGAPRVAAPFPLRACDDAQRGVGPGEPAEG